MYGCFHFTVAERRSHNTDPMANKGYFQGKSVNLVQSFASYWVQSLGYKEAHTSSTRFLSLSWMILSLISVPKLLLMALTDFLLSLPGDTVHFSQAWTWHMAISRFCKCCGGDKEQSWFYTDECVGSKLTLYIRTCLPEMNTVVIGWVSKCSDWRQKRMEDFLGMKWRKAIQSSKHLLRDHHEKGAIYRRHHYTPLHDNAPEHKRNTNISPMDACLINPILILHRNLKKTVSQIASYLYFKNMA